MFLLQNITCLAIYIDFSCVGEAETCFAVFLAALHFLEEPMFPKVVRIVAVLVFSTVIAALSVTGVLKKCKVITHI